MTLDRDLAPKEYTGDPGIWLVLRQGAEEVEHLQKFLLQGWRFPLCRPCDVPPMQPVTAAMKRQAARERAELARSRHTEGLDTRALDHKRGLEGRNTFGQGGTGGKVISLRRETRAQMDQVVQLTAGISSMEREAAIAKVIPVGQTQ